MDYYYALLDSYSLLKKREFKLSRKITITEGPQDEGQGIQSNFNDDNINTVKTTAAGSPSSKPGEAKSINDVELWLKKGTQRVMGRLGSRNAELIDEQGNKKEGPNQDMMWKNMFPDEGEEMTDSQDLPLDPGVNTDPMLEAAVDLGKFLENLREFEKEALESQIEALKRNQDLLMNLAPKEMEDTIVLVTEFLNLSLEIFNNPADANDGKYVEKINKFIEDNYITRNEEGVIFFNGISVGMTTDESPLGRAIGSAAREIDLVQRRRVSRQRGGRGIPETPLVDADRGTVGELLDALEPDFEKCLGSNVIDDSAENTDCDKFFDKLVNRVAAGEGKLLAEKVIATFLIGVAGGRDEILMRDGEQIDVYMARYVKKKIMDRTGMTEDQVEEYFDLLMDRYSNDEEKGKVALEALFMMVLANGDFARAIHGDAVPTRTEGTGQGQAGRSDLTGAKVDALDYYCKDEYKGKDKKEATAKVADHIRDNLLSKEQIKYYESACPHRSIDDIINDDLIREPDAWCYQVDREIKIHGKEKDSASTWGETSHQKRRALWSHLCEGQELEHDTASSDIKLDDEEKKFMNNIKDDFIGSFCEEGESEEAAAANKQKGEEALTAACKFNNEMDKEADPYLEVLQPGSWVDGVPDAAGDMIKSWFSKKYGPHDKAKAQQRAKAAIGCMKLSQTRMNNMERMKEYQEMDKASRDKKEPIPMDPADQADYQTAQQDKEDCVHLSKMKGEVQNAVFAQELDKHTDKDGYLTGGGLGFVQMQSMATSMGHNETLNDKRILEEDIQKTGLRNAEQRANIKHARYKRSKRGKGWTTTVSVINEDVDPKEKGDRTQRTRATFNAERGEFKVKSGTSKNVFNSIKPKDKSSAGEEPNDSKNTGESLLFSYLIGQHKLLEKLIIQTTPSPNI